MPGCNSCKHMDIKNAKPGRTSGYLYFCNLNKIYVNAAKDSCNAYEEDYSKSAYDKNESYRQSRDYNDNYTAHGCNTCAYLDPKDKGKGKNGGYIYKCKKKDGYVNAAKDNCENWENAYRDNTVANELYNSSKEYSNENNSSAGKYLFLLILMIIAGIILKIFTK